MQPYLGYDALPEDLLKNITVCNVHDVNLIKLHLCKSLVRGLMHQRQDYTNYHISDLNKILISTVAWILRLSFVNEYIIESENIYIYA